MIHAATSIGRVCLTTASIFKHFEGILNSCTGALSIDALSVGNIPKHYRVMLGTEHLFHLHFSSSFLSTRQTGGSLGETLFLIFR